MYVPPTIGFVNRTQWRWEEASTLAENTRKLQAGDATIPANKCFPRQPKHDKWVIGAYNFLIEKGSCAHDDTDAYRQLYMRHPDLYTAWILREGESPVAKDAIEAMLLGGESIDKLATEFGVPIEALEWYSELFFFIPEKATPLQVTTVYAPAIFKSDFSADDTDTVFKVLCGCVNLNVFYDMATFRPMTPDELSAHQVAYRSIQQGRATMAALTTSVNNFTSQSIVDSYQTAEKTHREAEASQLQLGGGIGELITQMLGAAKWVILDKNSDVSSLHTDRKQIEATVSK
jgi:hypothetical protein